MEKAPNHEAGTPSLLAIVTVHGETGKWLANGNATTHAYRYRKERGRGKGLVLA